MCLLKDGIAGLCFFQHESASWAVWSIVRFISIFWPIEDLSAYPDQQQVGPDFNTKPPGA